MTKHRYLRCILCGKEVPESDFNSETVLIHVLRHHSELVIALAESLWKDAETDTRQYTSE